MFCVFVRIFLLPLIKRCRKEMFTYSQSLLSVFSHFISRFSSHNLDRLGDPTGEDPIMSDQQQYNYMTSDENKQFDDTNITNMSIDPMKDEKYLEKIMSNAEKYPSMTPRESTPNPLDITVTDNVNITRKPIHVG